MREQVRAIGAAVLAAAAIVWWQGPVARAGASGGVADAATAAAEASIVSVSPPRGAVDASTGITAAGAGFEPGARVSLQNGGPFLTGSYIMPEGARAVEVTGSYACVAFYSHAAKLGGIQILDLTNPGAPAVVGAFETGDSGVGVQVAGGLAYVPFLNPYTYIGGLHHIHIPQPAPPPRPRGLFTPLHPPAGRGGRPPPPAR